uniref:Thiosulfate/3-mercaptopyruvate sulfurtransferase 1 isoform X2 n=1 Tax=Rhizophora mucronata TaxID=61149 RepID=A0A2P2L5T5_RHIMU
MATFYALSSFWHNAIKPFLCPGIYVLVSFVFNVPFNLVKCPEKMWLKLCLKCDWPNLQNRDVREELPTQDSKFRKQLHAYT